MINFLSFCILWTTVVSSPGSFISVNPYNKAAGQNPMYTTVVLAPPARWGRTNVASLFAAGGRNAILNTDGVFASDSVEIAMVGISTDVSNLVLSKLSWTMWNQYPVPTWKTFRPSPDPLVPPPPPPPPPAPSVNGIFNYGLVSSTPPCTFATSVAAAGAKITFFVVDCAGSGITNTAGANLLDELSIYVPEAYLAANLGHPQAIVTTQATFFIAENGGQKVGPVTVNVPFAFTTPELQLTSLQFLEIYPGAPSKGVKINTVVSTPIDAITVTLQLGVQLQAGNVISIQARYIPKIVADLQSFALTLTPIPNVIWADAVTSTDPAATFIPVGPACATRLGSTSCCSQSVGTILKPTPGELPLTSLWVSLVITLAPPGCVVPADKKFTFVIPKPYLGKNPDPTSVTTFFPGTTSFPGFVAVDTRVLTTKEPQPVGVQRYSESHPLAHVGLLAFGEAQGLPIHVSLVDSGVMLGPSSWVAGLSTLAALRVEIDTNVALIQPQSMKLSVTLTTGLTAIVTPAFTTQYWVFFTANQGVFRPNVGSLFTPIRLEGTQPGGCANAITALTTAYGTLMAAITDAACITALKDPGAVLTIAVSGAFLYPNQAAGSLVTFDVRVVPPQGTAVTIDLNGQANPADSAALMNVAAYTTVADCRTLSYQAGAVGDIAALPLASRCALVDSISGISPVTMGFLQCNPNANTNNAQNQVTFVKVAEGATSSTNWPGTNVPGAVSQWPQNVGMAGTPPIVITLWGVMFSHPMFAVVISYPPTRDNLRALGVTPAIPSTWLVAFLLRMDRLTTACSLPTDENPWTFCASTSANVVSVMHFTSNPLNRAGVAVESVVVRGGWSKIQGTAPGVCASLIADGAVAGFSTVALSPNGDDDSDGAWYAFFALFALPLLLLCCCLLLALLWLRKRKQPCCPGAPMAQPVQEIYCVAQPMPYTQFYEPFVQPPPYYFQ